MLVAFDVEYLGEGGVWCDGCRAFLLDEVQV
jgi:hypothetical protein